MSLYYVVTAENKCAGKLDTNTWARRDEDGRVEKWLLLRGARRRLARLALKNIYQETKTVVEKNKRMKM
jgi:hypothetical protein